MNLSHTLRPRPRRQRSYRFSCPKLAPARTPCEAWVITVEMEPGFSSDVTMAMRVRRLLKYALRACGLRATAVSLGNPVAPAEPFSPPSR